MLFFVLAIITIVTGFVYPPKITEVHLYDTYYIFSISTPIYGFAVLLLIGGGVYWLIDKWVYSQKLSWWHVIGTMVLLAILLLLEINATYYIRDMRYNDRFSFMLLNPVWFYLVIILWQLIFPYNLIRGLLRRP